MATTLQQLLDGLTQRATMPSPSATIADITGSLDHLGRALTGLAQDGITPGDSSRQRTTAELGAACLTAGRLWPHTGGPLTDLAGAAADLVGRDRDIMGRSHRWAVTVEVAEAADHCARLGRHVLPEAAAPELATVRELAVTVERIAQVEPPTASAFVVLDRLVAQPWTPGNASETTALDASAALVGAIERSRRTDDLSLRDFRAAVAAAEIISRSAGAVTAAASGDDAGPFLVTGLAWQVAGRASTVFDDGRGAGPIDARGVVACARTLAEAVRRDAGHLSDAGALEEDRDLPSVAASVQPVTGQLPVLANHLTAAVDRWSLTGRLYASARDLPPVNNMPEDRVQAVIVGRHVQAVGADLDHLRQTVVRATELSTGLADAFHRAAVAGPPAQRHQAALYVREVRASGVPERLLRHAQAVERDIATIRSPHQVPWNASPSR
ncbi:hypothetical protein SAMN05660662_0136 [Blastococcus aurantiacus]|uniref:Uncharacterized protein n=1 Tax=Blastococcus aurantiacus TaxID=1550231 RepID=A0A1G7R3M7_9ACTN|nr:hypothetical protein [Blastococcus aurantiacus]SDG04729.1 hypothetical protein SAMN05660662_0136 [Blastococcus aurantiacus]